MESDKRCDYKYLVVVDYSPEKAGVGGSTPSLATIKSITCEPLHSTIPTKTDQLVFNLPGTGKLSIARRRDSGISCTEMSAVVLILKCRMFLWMSFMFTPAWCYHVP